MTVYQRFSVHAAKQNVYRIRQVFVKAGVQVQGKPTRFLMELWKLACVRSTGFWLRMATWVRTWARSQAEHVETGLSPCWLWATTWLSLVSCHRLGSLCKRSPLSSPNAKAMDLEFELRLEGMFGEEAGNI